MTITADLNEHVISSFEEYQREYARRVKDPKDSGPAMRKHFLWRKDGTRSWNGVFRSLM
jgi:hypothetical protein